MRTLLGFQWGSKLYSATVLYNCAEQTADGFASLTWAASSFQNSWPGQRIVLLAQLYCLHKAFVLAALLG
jgi:hypothetical protein